MNSETFVFPHAAARAEVASFDVLLGVGGSGGGDAIVHIHPGSDETFTVHAGRLKVVVAGTERIVEAGGTMTVRRGEPHHFVNAVAGPTKATIAFSPPQRQLEFFRTFARLTERRPGWFGPRGQPPLLLMALFLDAFPDHLYVAGPPVWLQKLLFATLAPIARLRGYTLAVAAEAARTGAAATAPAPAAH